MSRLLRMFHYLSYLQYVFLGLALYFGVKPFIWQTKASWNDVNNELLFIGIALSFSSFYDIKKKHRLMDIVFGKKKTRKMFLITSFIYILLLFFLGFYSLLFTKNKYLNELSVGILVFGLGMLSILKMSIEIAKNYDENDHE